MEYTIRMGEVTDLPELIKINAQLGTYGWTEEIIHDLFSQQLVVQVAANSNQQIYGFIVASTSLDTINIINLTVDSECRNLGVGKSLLKSLLNSAQEFGFRYSLLNVRTDNTRALDLYHKLGFKILCLRNNYYDHLPNQHAYFMQLDLNANPLGSAQFHWAPAQDQPKGDRLSNQN